ncbi:MAG: hypothetical protein K8R87_09670 [Verrucomicrobia bacterium]|nr:hypothetical protein [Verrucomicrobiota bacterium]
MMSCLFVTTSLHSEETISKAVTIGNSSDAPADLSLSNFFSEGWNQPWSKLQRGEGTPDMSLLRVQTNFLVQLFRLDTSLETGRRSPGFSQSEFVNATVEYALNRRFMPAVFVNHQWLKGRHGSSEDGTAGGIFGRLQLIENRQSSLALNLKVSLPDRDVGEHLTTWSYALAGWEDLSPLGLGRTGFYYHVQHEIFAGPMATGGTRNDATYDVSLAKSWSSPQATLANFTTFVEGFGRTLLDGEHQGRTTTVLTPGFRFTLARRHILMCGVDLPVTSPRANDQIFRFTWISNF